MDPPVNPQSIDHIVRSLESEHFCDTQYFIIKRGLFSFCCTSSDAAIKDSVKKIMFKLICNPKTANRRIFFCPKESS